MITKKIKYATRQTLLAIAKFSQHAGLNRRLDPGRIRLLDPDLRYPIVWAMLHNDDHMRCTFALGPSGDPATVDIPIEVYNKLPTFDLEVDVRA